MESSIKTLQQMKKAERLVKRTLHKNGPKSYKDGQGALMKVLHKHNGSMESKELIDVLSFDRKTLKGVAYKAQRGGYVTIEDANGQRSYKISLTETGEELADKRCAAQEAVASNILEVLTPEELASLDAISEKLIVRCKELGAHGARKHGHTHHHHHHGRRHCHSRH